MRLCKTTLVNRLLLISLILGVVAVTAGCTARSDSGGVERTGVTEAVDLVEQAAAQATAIIQQARATALVLQAQSEATTLISRVDTPVPVEPSPLATGSPSLAGADAQATSQPATVPATPGEPSIKTPVFPSPAAVGEDIVILGVTYGAEGAYIVVNYLASPEIAQTFWPGVLSLLDETSGRVYNEVPVMPIIGPLIARPREQGQPGYFMLVNGPIPIQPGALITVVIGEARFEHIPVQ